MPAPGARHCGYQPQKSEISHCFLGLSCGYFWAGWVSEISSSMQGLAAIGQELLREQASSGLFQQSICAPSLSPRMEGDSPAVVFWASIPPSSHTEDNSQPKVRPELRKNEVWQEGPERVG